MVAITTRRKELREDIASSTCFKEHSLVFTDNAQFEDKHIVLLEEKIEFLFQNVYRPYIQSVIDQINGSMISTELISAMSVFDPRHLPCTEEYLHIMEWNRLRYSRTFIVLNQG